MAPPAFLLFFFFFSRIFHRRLLPLRKRGSGRAIADVHVALLRHDLDGAIRNLLHFKFCPAIRSRNHCDLAVVQCSAFGSGHGQAAVFQRHAGPSNFTSESAKTTTFEPEALMLAIGIRPGLDHVAGKNRGTAWHRAPLIQAVPLAYSMAGPESAAHKETGTTATILQQAISRSLEDTHAQLRSSMILAIIVAPARRRQLHNRIQDDR